MSILRFGQSLRKSFSQPPLERDYSGLPRTGRECRPGESVQGYQERLDQMNQSAAFMAYSAAVVACPKNKHFPGKAVFSCDHCHNQDPVHPDGVIRSPFFYFLCKTCYTRHMSRKLDLAYKLKTSCLQCIQDEITRIKAIDPGKFQDFLMP